MKTINKIKPRISIIIPTFNEENNIEETLIAAKNQQCDFPYEIIVVDGKSSDNTTTIAEKYAIIYISPKKGKAFQLNYAATKSKGEILLFLDADTLIDPLFLKKIFLFFQKDENLFACSARINYFNGKALIFRLGSIPLIITSYFFQNVFMHMYYFFKSFFGYPELSGCNMIVRREIYLKAGGFKQPPNSLGIDKVFSDSIIYLTRKLKRGKIKTLNFVSVLTSGRHLSTKRNFKRINQYFTQKDVYYELAKKKSVQ
jgi:cellulose synthase/poly-beta-1,6-N-acetylglucosamine synthase-like glycosyltransferase